MTKTRPIAKLIIMTQQFQLPSIIDFAHLRQNSLSKTVPFLLLASLMVIGGCANKDIVVSKDNSADYKSARLLPPLIKPTEEPLVASTPTDNVADNGAASELIEIVETQPIDVPTQSDPISKPEVIISQVSDPMESNPVQETAVAVAPIEVDNSSDGSSELAPAALDSTNIPELEPGMLTDGDTVKLILNSEFDSAWSYLTSQLAGSEVTVFSRNKSAGRIAIGCAEIRDGAAPSNNSKWSIFNRKAKRADEYCSLQAVERKGTTTVSVLNREGREVAGDDARLVLNKLLK